MSSRFYPEEQIVFSAHPRFAHVRIALLVSSKESANVSVSMLEIAPGASVPIHTHAPQVDSIYVVSGRGEAYVNREWRPIAAGDYLFVPASQEHGIRNSGASILKLFVHHAPPLL